MAAQIDGWQAVTEAFSFLRTQGVKVRQNFMINGGLASAKMHQAVADSPRRDTYRGVAYYSRENTANAFETGILVLSYGDAPESASKLASWVIGAMVAQAMRDAGLETAWDGKVEHCIYVTVDPETAKRHQAMVAAQRATWTAAHRS